MSIQKEKNGTYTLNYSKVDVMTQNVSRTKKRGFKTLKEAKAYERSLSRERSTVAFYSLFEELQKTIDQEQDTYLGKVSIINRYLPALKTIRYEDLTRPYLLAMRSQIARLDLSAKTKNKIIEIVVAVCRYASAVYDLDDNSKVIRRFKATEKKEMEVWTPKEYHIFEAALIGSFDDCIPYFRTLYMTGMRKGEARALTVDDLDLDKAVLTVNKSIRKYKSSIKAPKTPAGVRKIKLDRNTLELLRPLKQNEKWLFGDYRPISRDRVDRAFKYGIVRSGVKPIRIHDLRHSHATYLINNGANIVAVSKRLGHKSINVTLSTYAHLMEEAENQVVEILNVASL